MPLGATFRAPGESTGFHTCRDYGLYLADRPEIAEGKPETCYQKIPGKNGSLDLSEALTGSPVYNDRELKLRLVTDDPFPTWETLVTRLRNAIHGKRREIIFDDDDSYYYDARIESVRLAHDGYAAKIEITATAAPFKRELWESDGDWKWDPFEFDTMTARDLSGIEIPAAVTDNSGDEPVTTPGEVTVTILGTNMPVEPGFKLIAGTGVKVRHTGTIDYAGGTVQVSSEADLSIGTPKTLPSLTVRAADEEVTIINAGGTTAKVDVVMRDGSL